MADGETTQRAQFHSMVEGSAEDWAIIATNLMADRHHHADRMLDHLRLLGGDHGGFAVDRLEHSLQTATRAHQAGKDEEYVVCALFHDVGDLLLPSNHAELGAVLMKPYVSAENHWILEHHGVFQGYYFHHYLGGDRDKREIYRDHESFEACAQFCHLYDQNSFDPGFTSMPLEAFEPMVRRVLANRKM